MLANVAKQQDIQLLLLPEGLKQHQQNTSIANVNTSSIQWRIQFMFSKLHTQKSIVQAKVDDTTMWKHLIQSILGISSTRSSTPTTTTYTTTADTKVNNHIDVSLTTPMKKHNKTVDASADKNRLNPILKHELRDYINAGIDNLSLFMQIPLQPANAPCYYHLSMNDAIRQSLQHKYLIEFPVVYVALASECHLYSTTPVIAPGDVSSLVDASASSDDSSSDSNEESDSDSDSDTTADDSEHEKSNVHEDGQIDA